MQTSDIQILLHKVDLGKKPQKQLNTLKAIADQLRNISQTQAPAQITASVTEQGGACFSSINPGDKDEKAYTKKQSPNSPDSRFFSLHASLKANY